VSYKDFQGYSTYTKTTVSNSTTLQVISTSDFTNSGSIKVNNVTYTYTGITPTSITGISPMINGTTYNGEYIQFINALSELYNKQYGHIISKTTDKVRVEWTDNYGDTNIIRF